MILVWAALGLCAYAYVGYPLLLKLLGVVRRAPHRAPPDALGPWPPITILLPVYNEAEVIAATLERLLELEFPGPRQILVVSDASTDGTDAIVAGFAERGVQLLRLARRAGKTAAENAARARVTGDIVVSTDASVRIRRDALRPLIAAFADPTVGVASGRDVSVAAPEVDATAGERSYVGYEMWVRDLETRIFGVVGASGCLYAIRRELHDHVLPEQLSRDFAAALVARERGYRAVSVADAVCYVPRSASLRREYRRKVRTITRGLGTLWYKRALLNPVRYGVFAWMLLNHKLCRWLAPWTLLPLAAGLGLLAGRHLWARITLVGLVAVGALAGVAWHWPEGRRVPRPLALAAYAVWGNVAALHAWLRVLAGVDAPVWEPTRRVVLPGAAPADHHRQRAQHDLQVLDR